VNRLRQSFSWWCFENRGVPGTHLLKEAKTIGYHGVDLLLEGLWDQRDPQLGLEQLAEAVVLFRQAGDWRFLAQTLGILGCAVLSNGELESAQEFLDEAYELNRQSNNSAMEFVLTGKPEVAARLIGWSDATREEIGDPRPRTVLPFF
jgi:hypothetical protein